MFTWPTALAFGPTQGGFYQKISPLSSPKWAKKIRDESTHITNFSILPRALFITDMCKISRAIYILVNRRSSNTV